MVSFRTPGATLGSKAKSKIKKTKINPPRPVQFHAGKNFFMTPNFDFDTVPLREAFSGKSFQLSEREYGIPFAWRNEQ
jgi:hypothetical protein